MASVVGAEAHPTCAVALADAVAKPDAVTFQINRCLLDAPLDTLGARCWDDAIAAGAWGNVQPGQQVGAT